VLAAFPSPRYTEQRMDILPQLVANSVIAGATYALVAVGFSLVYGTTKFFNLAHGSLTAVGGYAAFTLLNAVGLGPVAAVILAAVFSGILGVLLYAFIFGPLRQRHGSHLVLLVASLGVSTALQSVLAMIYTSQFQTLSTGESRVFQIGGAAITDVQLVIIGLSVLATVFLGFYLKTTRMGRAIRAVSDDEEVAKIAGIPSEKVIRYVCFAGSALTGAAGAMVGFDTGIEPTMGLSLLLKGVIGTILGGAGSVVGAFFGSMFLGFAENFGIWKISGEWKDAIAFVVLILFLLVKPLWNKWRKRAVRVA